MKQNGFVSLLAIVVFGAIIVAVVVFSSFRQLNLSQFKNPIPNISHLNETIKTKEFPGKDTGDDIITSTISPTLAPTPTPTPVPVGNFSSKVIVGYYSRETEGIRVIIENNSFSKSTTSGANGRFSFSGIPIGNYTLKGESNEYTFAKRAVEIKKGENSLINFYGYLTNPRPTKIVATVYNDVNGNGTRDANDSNFSCSFELKYDTGNNNWVLKNSYDTDQNGNFSIDLLETGKYKLKPIGKTFYREPGEIEFIVDGYGGIKTYSFGYFPQVSTGGFKIFVFNDKNENGNREGDEENIHYQVAKISYLSGTLSGPLGNTWNVAVPPEGDLEDYKTFGQYKVELVPESSSWEAYYKITKREQIVFLTSESSQQEVYLGAHKLY